MKDVVLGIFLGAAAIVLAQVYLKKTGGTLAIPADLLGLNPPAPSGGRWTRGNASSLTKCGQPVRVFSEAQVNSVGRWGQ